MADASEMDGATALWSASIDGDAAEVAALLAANAEVDQVAGDGSWKGATPLNIAS